MVDIVTIPGTEYYFVFDSSSYDNARYAEYAPGQDEPSGKTKCRNWGEMARCFNFWCGYLKRELAATDPWAELERQTVSFNLRLDSEETNAAPFSVSEHRKVLQTLDAIKALLITYSKESNSDNGQILAGISKLAEAAESQDRTTWFQLALGFIMSTAVSMALAPEQTKAIFILLRDGLEGTIKFLP